MLLKGIGVCLAATAVATRGEILGQHRDSTASQIVRLSHEPFA
jgi:hypothetical protein